MPLRCCRCEDQCEEQPRCGPGQFLNGATLELMGTCKDCVDDNDGTQTYMNETNHHEQQCRKWDLKCGKGEKVSKYDPKKSPVCEKCENKTYQDQDGHQENKCEDQKFCAPGEKSSLYTNTEKQSCLPCDPHTYRDDAKHRKEQCVTQPLCKQNETYVLSAADNFTANAICLDCNAAVKAPGHPLYDALRPERNTDPDAHPVQMTYNSNHRDINACVPVPQASADSGSGGAVAATVIILLLLIGGVVAFLWHRKQQESKQAEIKQRMKSTKRPTREKTGGYAHASLY